MIHLDQDTSFSRKCTYRIFDLFHSAVVITACPHDKPTLFFFFLQESMHENDDEVTVHSSPTAEKRLVKKKKTCGFNYIANYLACQSVLPCDPT